MRSEFSREARNIHRPHPEGLPEAGVSKDGPRTGCHVHGYEPELLLARPHDARDPQHLIDRERALGMRRIERAQLDRLRGAALELPGHDLAVLGLDHDAVAAP